ASTTNDVANGPMAGLQPSVTVAPATIGTRLPGLFGATTQASAGTMAGTSKDGGLTPALFAASTRMKYVPGGTLAALSVVAVLPVEKFARFGGPPRVDEA